MAHKVKIAARLRPRLQGEVDDEGVTVIREGGMSCITVPNPRDVTQIFKFPLTSCYGADSTQEEIFEQDVRPMIDVVFGGVTVTVFAYGVTSSGKTHTMQGTREQPGVIPRVVKAIFERTAGMTDGTVSLAVSYMEIYKDEVYDLLVTRETAPKLPVRESDSGQVFVANLSFEPIESVAQFEAIYSRANKGRSVGATNLNRASSRSHAVLTIEVSMLDAFQGKTLTGKINLVDLAGSENNKLTGNDPTRMAESSAINKSLSVLGQVVHALNQGASRIPYRNSKLTRLLQDALGGNSVGLLICNLAPGLKFRQDTLNTLNFAVRTKNVENNPVVNERDNRPAPKAHFAALAPRAPKLAPAAIPEDQEPSDDSARRPPRKSLAPIIVARRAPTAGRKSIAPGPSRVPRASMVPGGFGMGLPMPMMQHAAPAVGMSAAEFEERIKKEVEAQMAKIMASQRAKDEEAAQAAADVTVESGSRTIPAGVLTPLLQRQMNEEELVKRLEELEKRIDHEEQEVKFADALSPVSRKKTGRSYVALGRIHSEKGNLEAALDNYRKAAKYVPDNMKLQERIIEIEYAIKNGVEFKPARKRSKKSKGGAGGKKVRVSKTSSSDLPSNGPEAAPADAAEVEEQMEVENLVGGKRGIRQSGSGFGFEVTNSGSPLGKRPAADVGEAEQSPVKRKREAGRAVKKQIPVEVEESDDEFKPDAPPRRSRRKAACY